MTTVVEFARSQNGGPTLAATPAAGDVAFLLIMGNRSVPRTVTALAGLGATWTEVYNSGDSRLVVYKGEGSLTPGTVTITFSGTQAYGAALALVRNLSSTAVAGAVAQSASALSAATTPATVASGQAVLSLAVVTVNPITFPASQSPSGAWSTVVNGTLTGAAHATPASADPYSIGASQSTANLIAVGQVVIGSSVATVPTVTGAASGSGVASASAAVVRVVAAAALGAGLAAATVVPVLSVAGEASGSGVASASTVAVPVVPVTGGAAGSGLASAAVQAVGQAPAVTATALGSGAASATVGVVIPVVVTGAASGEGVATATVEVVAPPAAPANDDWADAYAITGSANLGTHTFAGATYQSGEPTWYATGSLWWKFTAIEATTLEFATADLVGDDAIYIDVYGEASGGGPNYSNNVASTSALAGQPFVPLEMAAAGTYYLAVAGDPYTPSTLNLTVIVDGEEIAGPAETVTSNRTSGRTRDGYAIATWEPPVVEVPLVGTSHAVVRGAAFGAVTMRGTQPVYAVSEAVAPRARQRILVGGKDITYWRDVVTPHVDYQLAEPLGYGPATLTLPQVAACFERPGFGALRFLRKGAPVVVQRVLDGTVVGTDWRGFVVAYDTAGRNLTVELGGEAQGRAVMRDKQVPIFRDALDLGRMAWRAIKDLGLPFEPRLGPDTGITLGTFGGMGHLDYIADLCAKGWTRAGNQWTIMPDNQGVYRMTRKDTTTVDFTVFADDARTVANLRRDTAEEPNRVFVTGVTPNGQRVRNGVYPGLQQSKAAPYPFNNNRTFGDGTTNADTDTGDGISVLVQRLRARGYLSMEDVPGGYDAEVHNAILDLQTDAGFFDDGFGTTSPGWVDVKTWRALFDLDVTGYDLTDSHIEPMAQRSAVRHYRRSPAGSVMGLNPNYDPHHIVVDETIDMGTGFKRQQMREWAKAELIREENWVGTIAITTGAVLVGDVLIGATVTPEMLMDARAIRPGMNARLPLFDGGTLVHVSGVDVSEDDVTLTVDTQARDAAKVWEVITRNRETRNDPARRWRGNRASTEVKDAIDVWDEIGGVLDGDVDLEPGWNVIPVVAGQEGSVSRVELIVQDVSSKGGTIAVQGREFAFAVFGRPVTAARLRHLIGNPLAASPEATTEPTSTAKDAPAIDPETDDQIDPSTSTPAVGPWWERRAVAAKLRERDMLLAKGTREEPCGYSPGRKQAGATRTGLEIDDAGFSYRTGPQPVLYLAVWVWGPRTLVGGRVMWNQLEAGA